MVLVRELLRGLWVELRGSTSLGQCSASTPKARFRSEGFGSGFGFGV